MSIKVAQLMSSESTCEYPMLHFNGNLMNAHYSIYLFHCCSNRLSELGKPTLNYIKV